MTKTATGWFCKKCGMEYSPLLWNECWRCLEWTLDLKGVS